MAENTQSEYTYYAFISYNAKDMRWGKRLQKPESYSFHCGVPEEKDYLVIKEK